MKKAFIFDMDGVIIDSESLWLRYEKQFLPKLLGQDIYAKIKDQILGSTVTKIYETACNCDLKIAKKKFVEVYDSYARVVYKEAKITPNIETLIDKLIAMNFRLALVSSSRKLWIDLVLIKIPETRNKFQYILSLNDKGIQSKPAADGYQKAMKILGVKPNETIILEDSQRGIQAAKASGAFTICLKENISRGESIPKNADIYVETVRDIIKQIDSINL